jgi:hypothetical protein
MGDNICGVINHLKASRQLLFTALKLPSSQLDDETRSFLVEVYAYAAITANITFGPDSDSWILEDATLLLPMLRANKDHVLTVSGCPTDLFELIPRVSILAGKRLAEQENLGYSSWEIASEHLSLRGKIQRWTSKSTDPHVMACHRIYQQAILVYLESAFTKDASTDPVGEHPTPIEHAFDVLIESLDQLPVESPHATTLCWPLVVFGSSAKTSYHHSVIRQRLLELHRVIGAKNLKETLQFLENVWVESDHSYKPSKISNLLKQHALELYFF